MTPDRTAELQEAISAAEAEPFITLQDAAVEELTRLWGEASLAKIRAKPRNTFNFFPGPDRYARVHPDQFRRRP